MTIQELYENLDDFLEKWPDRGDLNVLIDGDKPIKDLEFNYINLIINGSNR